MNSTRRFQSLSKAKLADTEIARGAGGETHETAGRGVDVLTTQQGAPIADDQNSLKAGARGPTLLEDLVLRDKIFHFDHERIPERVVHARGFGAHGFFETYESLADITSADIFQRAGEKTLAFVRFSTVAGSKGSADLARDVRGFAADEGATVEFIAPKIGGFTDSDGTLHSAQQNVKGGPSVVYDAVVILLSADGARLLANEATAKDFVIDAFAHAKFIGHTETALTLIQKAGIEPDEGVILLKVAADAVAFIGRCRELRLWKREARVRAV